LEPLCAWPALYSHLSGGCPHISRPPPGASCRTLQLLPCSLSHTLRRMLAILLAKELGVGEPTEVACDSIDREPEPSPRRPRIPNVVASSNHGKMSVTEKGRVVAPILPGNAFRHRNMEPSGFQCWQYLHARWLPWLGEPRSTPGRPTRDLSRTPDTAPIQPYMLINGEVSIAFTIEDKRFLTVTRSLRHQTARPSQSITRQHARFPRRANLLLSPTTQCS